MAVVRRRIHREPLVIARIRQSHLAYNKLISMCRRNQFISNPLPPNARRPSPPLPAFTKMRLAAPSPRDCPSCQQPSHPGGPVEECTGHREWDVCGLDSLRFFVDGRSWMDPLAAFGSGPNQRVKARITLRHRPPTLQRDAFGRFKRGPANHSLSFCSILLEFGRPDTHLFLCHCGVPDC